MKMERVVEGQQQAPFLITGWTVTNLWQSAVTITAVVYNGEYLASVGGAKPGFAGEGRFRSADGNSLNLVPRSVTLGIGESAYYLQDYVQAPDVSYRKTVVF